MTRRILIVDDKKILRDTLIDYLGTDYLFIEAETGEIALEKFRDTDVDLVILDANLPGINGIKTLQLMKKLKKSIPVIGLTGELTVEIREQFLQAGCYDVHAKSAIYEKLLASIESALEGKEARILDINEIEYEKMAQQLMESGRWEESALYLKEAGVEKEILGDYSKAIEFYEEASLRYSRAGRKTKEKEIDDKIKELSSKL